VLLVAVAAVAAAAAVLVHILQNSLELNGEL